MERNERRFTVSIDVDNAFPKHIKYTLDEASDVGITTYERIYGDRTDNEKRSWKNVLPDWSVSPIQQYSYTTRKNATDLAVIIDAMDTLYSGNVDGFRLVSSDSSFTELTQRLREVGMSVMGVGEQKTPKPFRATYDMFKLLEIISFDNALETSVIENQETITNAGEVQKAITKLLVENNSQNQPAVFAKVGNFLAKHFPDFDVRNYGCSKFSTSLESLNNNDFQVVKLHGGCFAQEKGASISKIEIEKEVIRVIRGYNGHVDNLGIVYDELEKTYPSFNVKQHGFSHISSFIRSFGTLRARDDMIQFK